MLVLLTRALDEGMRTADKLAALGHHAILSPVLEMTPTGAEWPQGVVDAVLATSAQAFDLLSASADWPAPETRRLMPLYVVGERTLAAARERGFGGSAEVAPDARTLATIVAASLGDGGARLLYLAGRDRKPDLEASLKAAGHRVDALEVYAAEPAETFDPEAAILVESGQIGAVLHYSRRSAQLFLTLARDAGLDIAGLAHFAISADAAEPLAEAGLRSVRAAAEPKEHALLALLAEAPAHAFVDRAAAREP